MNRGIKIIGSGVYIPEQAVSSESLDLRFNKKTGTIARLSGCSMRYVAQKHEYTSYMGAQAALTALQNAQLTLSSIDCIISACGVMEQAIPSTAALIQRELGAAAYGIPCFDINVTCLSFLTAFDYASLLINAGTYKNILIITSEIPSSGINWNDLASASLFGDGATATILSLATSADASALTAYKLSTWSSGTEYCYIKGGGTRYNPQADHENIEANHYFFMDGKKIYEEVADKIPLFFKELFNQAALSLDDIAMVIPHQASGLALRHLQEYLHLSDDRIMKIFTAYGNQMASSIPHALHQAITSHKIKRGDNILLFGTAAGVSISGMIIRY